MLLVTITQVVDENDAKALEAYYIQRYLKNGIALCNILTPEQKRRIGHIEHIKPILPHRGKMVLTALRELMLLTDELHRAGKGQVSILKSLFGVKPGKNRAYIDAKHLYEQILRK